MVAASTQGGNGTGLTADADAVLKRTPSLAAYKSFRLLDSLVVRVREGRMAEANGNLPAGSYSLHLGAQIVGTHPSETIHLDDLRLNLRVPVQTGANQSSFADSTLRTDVDIRDGQSVLAGKASLLPAPESELILIVSAKVID